MKLGYVITAERGATDRLLSEVAARCIAEGVRVAGIVQTNTESAKSHLCDMDVQVLPDGPVFRISQSLGKEARGCRLDPAALEAAVGEVTKTLSPPPDLLIVNKFGKQEAAGHGMRAVIAAALGMGIPVVVGLNGMNRAAFEDFTGGLAEEIAPTPEALLAWAADLPRSAGRAA